MRRISELRTLRHQAKRVLDNIPAVVEQDVIELISETDDPFKDCQPGDKVAIMGGGKDGTFLIDEHGQPQPVRAAYCWMVLDDRYRPEADLQ